MRAGSRQRRRVPPATPEPYFIVRNGKMEETKRRHVGIGLGKREWAMAVIGKNGKMSIHHGKTSL
jgi:hypothetical protein